MVKINIGVVVRTYGENGRFDEMRFDNISCENISEEIMKEIINGEIICVKLMENVEAFYFNVPNDWPENRTELGCFNEK